MLDVMEMPAAPASGVFHFGWQGRIFRCIERQLEYNEEAGRVVLTCLREDAGVYTDMLTADYTTGTSATDTFTSDEPDVPTALVATGLHNGIRFTWTLPANLPAGWVAELWEHTASTPFASATRIWFGAASETFVAKADTTTRYYWVRIRARTGHLSATEPASTGVAGAAVPLVEVATDSDVGPIVIEKPGDGTTETIEQVFWVDFTAAEATTIEVTAQFRLGIFANPGFTVRAYAYRGTSSAIGISDARTEKTDNLYENGVVIGTFTQAAGTYRAGLAVEIDGLGTEIVEATFRDITVRARILRP